MSTHQLSSPLPRYKSVIANWDSKSSVRSKPRRQLSEDDEGRSFFSAAVTPTASHPLVTSRGEQAVQELLTRRLYSYLDFTTVLEQEIVNPVVLRLSRDSYGLVLPGDMRFDAYRIYCDEAYHALFSVDIKKQVEASSGVVSPNDFPEPDFARVIHRVKATLPTNLHGLVELCAAIVSETLISGTLTQIPADLTVVESVRETIADHAADERTHHAYFAKLVEAVWPQIDATTQRLLGPCFADFIIAFLAPDHGIERGFLNQMTFSGGEASQILSESHPADKTLADIRYAGRSTIRLLERAGALEHNRTRDRFAELGLID